MGCSTGARDVDKVVREGTPIDTASPLGVRWTGRGAGEARMVGGRELFLDGIGIKNVDDKGPEEPPSSKSVRGKLAPEAVTGGCSEPCDPGIVEGGGIEPASFVARSMEGVADVRGSLLWGVWRVSLTGRALGFAMGLNTGPPFSACKISRNSAVNLQKWLSTHVRGSTWLFRQNSRGRLS